MTIRYASLTNDELVAALKQVNEDIGMAQYKLSDNPRSGYWYNRVRTLCGKRKRIYAVMGEKGLAYTTPKKVYKKGLVNAA
jgi:hypothetical protein